MWHFSPSLFFPLKYLENILEIIELNFHLISYWKRHAFHTKKLNIKANSNLWTRAVIDINNEWEKYFYYAPRTLKHHQRKSQSIRLLNVLEGADSRGQILESISSSDQIVELILCINILRILRYERILKIKFEIFEAYFIYMGRVKSL